MPIHHLIISLFYGKVRRCQRYYNSLNSNKNIKHVSISFQRNSLCNNFNVQQRLVYCGKPNIWIYWFILALWSPIRVLGRHWFGIMSLMMHYLNKCLIIISIAPSLGTLSVDIPITHVPYYHNDPQQQGWNGQWHYKIIYRASTHLHTSCSESKLQVAIDFSRFHSKSHQIFLGHFEWCYMVK